MHDNELVEVEVVSSRSWGHLHSVESGYRLENDVWGILHV